MLKKLNSKPVKGSMHHGIIYDKTPQIQRYCTSPTENKIKFLALVCRSVPTQIPSFSLILVQSTSVTFDPIQFNLPFPKKKKQTKIQKNGHMNGL